MTAPNPGPCVCDDVLIADETMIGTSQHEHAEFEPYACADCDCPRFRPAGSQTETAQNQAQINADGSERPPAGDRPHLVIPAELDFTQDRVTQTAEWLNQTLAGIRVNQDTPPDNPHVVCILADWLENHWPEHLDPYDALALTISRLKAQPDSTARRLVDTIRRKVQR